MKKLIATFCLAAFLIFPSFAEDHTYVAIVKGITCSGCQSTVTSALKSLEASKVEITANEALPGTKKVIVTAPKEISAYAAVKSLGDHADSYVILTWTEAAKSAN